MARFKNLTTQHQKAADYNNTLYLPYFLSCKFQIKTTLLRINQFTSVLQSFQTAGLYTSSWGILHPFISLLSKNESSLIKSVVCLSVYPPLVTSEPMVDFHEIWYVGNAI
jgi:hypothetical protein